jgi:probable F420-dependent oxidoreductase
MRLARLADEIGFDSVWAGEHVVLPNPHVAPAPMQPTDPILDPLVHLAFVAAASPRLLLGTGIIILPQRNPLVLAKQAASLDVLSDGRLLLGIGAGYLEPEMSAIGAPMHERGRRTDDYIAAMRAIWNEPGPVSFESPSFRYGGVDAHPRPVQPGGPRIIVGGHTPAAYRRAVGSGHGWYGFALTPDATAACVAGLKDAADAVERPVELGSLEITVTPRGRLDAAGIEAFAAAGVDRLVMNTAGAADPDTVAERMQAAAALL